MTIKEMFAVRRVAEGSAALQRGAEGVIGGAGRTMTAVEKAAKVAPISGEPLTVRAFIESLIPWIVAGSLFLIAATFAAHFGENTQVERILRRFDLRREGNPANFGEGMLFLFLAFTYAHIALSGAGKSVVPRATRALFILFALGNMYLSYDDMFVVHEQVGMAMEAKEGLFAGSALQGHGFAWLLIYGPVFLVSLVAIGYPTSRIVAAMADAGRRRRARMFLYGGLASVVLVLASEIAAGIIWFYFGIPRTILAAFEETAEFGVLGGLAACNVLIAREFDL